MLKERFLRHLLHACVDACVNLQTICVDVIVRTIFLRVLVAPAIKRVGFPSHRVIVILLSLPRSILTALRTLCHHDDTQVLTEVWCCTFFVRSDFGFGQQRERLCLHLIHFCLCDIALFHHLSQHHVAAFHTAFALQKFTVFSTLIRIVERRVLTHAHQSGALVKIQVNGVFAEIGSAGILHAHTHVEEVEIVEVHRHDFLFGVVAFQLHGDEPFDRFLHHTCPICVRHIRIELLRQLLRDG